MKRSPGISFINMCKIQLGVKKPLPWWSLMDIFVITLDVFYEHQKHWLIVWSTTSQLFQVNLTRLLIVPLLFSNSFKCTKDIPIRSVSEQQFFVSFNITCVLGLGWSSISMFGTRSNLNIFWISSYSTIILDGWGWLKLWLWLIFCMALMLVLLMS